MQYRTVMADPPWPESGGGQVKRGADRHYPLMTIKEIISLPVKDLAAPDSHLYLWVTNNYLPEGLIVMQAWGFRYITMITWAKVDNAGRGQIGLGQYFRGMTEHCLFGVRGETEYKVEHGTGKRLQGRTLIQVPKGRHSEKPEELRHMAVKVSHAPRVELFARETFPGWDRFGNEVKSNVELPVFKPGRLQFIEDSDGSYS